MWVKTTEHKNGKYLWAFLIQNFFQIFKTSYRYIRRHGNKSVPGIKLKVWMDLEQTLKGSQWDPRPNITAGCLSGGCYFQYKMIRTTKGHSEPLWGTEYDRDIQQHNRDQKQLGSGDAFITAAQHRGRSPEALQRQIC
jgi:hypothetical protein